MFFEEPVARISPNGFSMGILAICFSLFCYLFIFYIPIYIYLVTMCKKNGKNKSKLKLKLNLQARKAEPLKCCFELFTNTEKWKLVVSPKGCFPNSQFTNVLGQEFANALF